MLVREKDLSLCLMVYLKILFVFIYKCQLLASLFSFCKPVTIINGKLSKKNLYYTGYSENINVQHSYCYMKDGIYCTVYTTL